MEGSSVARFKEILKVFTSYGLGYLLGKKEEKEKKSPSNLRKAFEELGPTFIKIGQILSTRQELIPEEYIIELSKLQDNVASDKFEDMAKVFYDEFNKNIEDEFLYISGRSKKMILTKNGENIYPEEIEMLLDKIEEIKEVMVYGKKPEKNSKREEKELIITARVIPDFNKIKEKYGQKTKEEIHEIIWKKIKEENKKLESFKAVKKLEIKEGEFEKSSTMKIKRYKELEKDCD